MKYHFSAKFSDSELSYHGEFDTVLKDVDDIVKKAKIEFKQKCKVWNIDHTKVVKFDVYFYTSEWEQKIFEYVS